MESLVLTHLTIPEIKILFRQELQSFFEAKNHLQPQLQTSDQWYDLKGLCEYHPEKPAAQTVYQWVSANLIPYHKSGKKLRFLKSEIDAWLRQGKSKTFADAANEADLFLSAKGKDGRGAA